MKVEITDQTSFEQAAKQLLGSFVKIGDALVGTYEPTKEPTKPTPIKCEYNKNFICEPRERIPPYAWDIFACFQCMSDRIISLERKQKQTERKVMLQRARR